MTKVRNDEVEVLKIGTIIQPVRINGMYDTSIKPTAMVVFDAGPTFDYYVNILREECKDDYSFLKTAKSIISERFSTRVAGRVGEGHSYVGKFDDYPQVGKSFTLGNGSWSTTTVINIIDENIIITMNSIYAIHDVSKMRDKKLKDLGI
jgi:hypothetical protein